MSLAILGGFILYLAKFENHLGNFSNIGEIFVVVNGQLLKTQLGHLVTLKGSCQESHAQMLQRILFEKKLFRNESKKLA